MSVQIFLFSASLVITFLIYLKILARNDNYLFRSPSMSHLNSPLPFLYFEWGENLNCAIDERHDPNILFFCHAYIAFYVVNQLVYVIMLKGSHLVPLSRLEALTRVEGHYRSNNDPTPGLDKPISINRGGNNACRW